MNPTRIWARSYRSFGEFDLELPSGCIAIIGPNGAGKSSLINAIDVALFAGRGELASLLSVDGDELEIGCEFEHAGELYRIRRQYDGRGRGKSTLDFERLIGLEWEPATRETAEATQELIEETLGLSRTTFRASAFLRQGDGAAFTEASPRDRKAVLAEILDLQIWDRLLELARDEIRRHATELATLDGKTAAAQDLAGRRVEFEERLIAAQTDAGNLANGLAEAEQKLDETRQAIATNQTIVERVRALDLQLSAAVEAEQRAGADLLQAEQAEEELTLLRSELERVTVVADQAPALEQRLNDIREKLASADEARRARAELEREAEQRDLARERLANEAARLIAFASELAAKIEHARHHDGARCDRCEQIMGVEAAAKAIASFEAEEATARGRARQIADQLAGELAAIAELRARAVAIVIPEPSEDPAPLEGDLLAARLASERRAAVGAGIATHSTRAARLPEAKAAMEAARAKRIAAQAERQAAGEALQDPAALERTETVWKDAVVQNRVRLEQARADVTRAETELARIVEAEETVAAAMSERERILKQLDVLKLAERAFSPDGVPALIVENAAIPQIELEANRILAELGTSYHVELRTQRALKTADHLRETLDIVIHDGVYERPYETFSGGERTRLNLALRIGLARLLAHRRGAESRLLAIDEPEFLDEAGVARLADVLRGLSGDFDRILLISHVPTLSASFDTTIEISKDADRSRVDFHRQEPFAA